MARPKAATKAQVERAVVSQRGNLAAAARQLGVSKPVVYRRMHESSSLRHVVNAERITRMLESARN